MCYAIRSELTNVRLAEIQELAQVLIHIQHEVELLDKLRDKRCPVFPIRAIVWSTHGPKHHQQIFVKSENRMLSSC